MVTKSNSLDSELRAKRLLSLGTLRRRSLQLRAKDAVPEPASYAKPILKVGEVVL
jgi:hypothetical protein